MERFRTGSGGRATAQAVSQRTQHGPRGIPSRGLVRRFGGFRWGGGFGALAGGVPIQRASALVGRRGGGLVPTVVAPMTLDRFVPLMLEPFTEAEDLEEGDGYAANGR